MNEHTGTINGAMDEWIDGVQCGDKLRHALMFDEDDNYCELQADKYQNEFIFRLFQFIAIGGQLCQFENHMSEFLDCTKDLYKDLITVAKEEETGEIKPRSLAFKITGAKAVNGSKISYEDHIQEFCYILVDPLNWHITLFKNRWTKKW